MAKHTAMPERPCTACMRSMVTSSSDLRTPRVAGANQVKVELRNMHARVSSNAAPDAPFSSESISTAFQHRPPKKCYTTKVRSCPQWAGLGMLWKARAIACVDSSSSWHGGPYLKCRSMTVHAVAVHVSECCRDSVHGTTGLCSGT